MKDSIVALGEGDREEYRCLFEECGLELLRLAAGILWDVDEAEDIVQESFLRLFDTARRGKLGHADGSANRTVRARDKPSPALDRVVPAFLRRTVRNLSVDRLRRRETRRRFSEKGELAEPLRSQSPFEWSEGREIERRFFSMLGELSDLQRVALVLRVLQDESYQEISRALGISVESVKTHLSRARAKLKPLLDEYSG